MTLDMIKINGVWIWEGHYIYWDEASKHSFDSMHYMFSGLSTPRDVRGHKWIRANFMKKGTK